MINLQDKWTETYVMMDLPEKVLGNLFRKIDRSKSQDKSCQTPIVVHLQETFSGTWVMINLPAKVLGNLS